MIEFSDKFGDFRIVRTKANDTAEPQFWIVRQDLEQVLKIKSSKIVVQELPIPISDTKVECLECIALDDTVYSVMTGYFEKLAMHIQCNVEDFARIEEEEEELRALEEDDDGEEDDEEGDWDDEDDDEDEDEDEDAYGEYDEYDDDEESDLLHCAEMRASAIKNLCDVVDATPMDRYNALAPLYWNEQVLPYDVSETILDCYIPVEELADCLQSSVSQTQKLLREKRFISEGMDHPIGKGRLYAFQVDGGEWRWHIKVLDILKA